MLIHTYPVKKSIILILKYYSDDITHKSKNRVSYNYIYIYIYIYHAPNVKYMWQRPHTHFGVTPTMMHTGTNQKAQQSCGSSTNRE